MKIVLVLALGLVAVAAQDKPREWRSLGAVLGESGGNTIRSMEGVCQMRKPVDDTCVELTPDSLPFCEPENCTFVPQYGEEVTNFWEIYFDWFNQGKQKKYREILDLGEHMTKSHDAVICRNENAICDCDNLDDCICNRDDKVRVCRQKFTYKYGFYWVLNSYYCERTYSPWYYFWKMINGGDITRHFTSVQAPAGPPSYNPQSQSPTWQYILHYIMPLLKKEKHSHLGELVPCSKQPKPSYGYPKPTKPNSYYNYYNLDMNALVKHTFLKVKVPDGCECEEI